MNQQQGVEVYVEFTAARDGFCLVRDTISGNDVIKGRFDTIKQATDWAETNGYVVYEYVDGKLQPKH